MSLGHAVKVISAQLRFASALLRLTKKSRLALPFAQYAAFRAKRNRSGPPLGLAQAHAVSQRRIDGFVCYSISPRDTAPIRAVMYIHGGKYVRRITRHHWRFIRKLVDAGFRVDVPLYGLAPRNSHRDAIPFLTTALDSMMSDSTSEFHAIVGDSAGGALAVVLSQHRVATGQSLPDRLVLISPWVDVTMTNPEVPAADKRDPWLKPATLIRNGQSWASGDDTRLADISPIYGELSNLPPSDLYIGTHDVLYPDALRFSELATAAGSSVTLHIQDQAFHNFVLAPIPEGEKATSEIIDRLNRS